MILAVDTSGRFAVVSVTDEQGRIRYARTGDRPRGHAEDLGPLAAEAMQAGRLAAVVAGRGPGSFTGLRVGLCFAQVLGWARDAPVTGICTLDVIAEQEGLRDGWVVMDARRRELYAGRYEGGRLVEGPTVVGRDAARALVAGVAVIGDVALLGEQDRRATGSTVVDAAALAACAARAVKLDPTQPPTPLYLRRPDVTLAPPRGPGAPGRTLGRR